MGRTEMCRQNDAPLTRLSKHYASIVEQKTYHRSASFLLQMAKVLQLHFVENRLLSRHAVAGPSGSHGLSSAQDIVICISGP